MQPCFIPGHKNRVFPYFTSRTISDLQLLAICDTAAIAVGGARFAGESLGRELAIAKKVLCPCMAGGIAACSTGRAFFCDANMWLCAVDVVKLPRIA
jgi:hypothetical protein